MTPGLDPFSLIIGFMLQIAGVVLPIIFESVLGPLLEELFRVNP